VFVNYNRRSPTHIHRRYLSQLPGVTQMQSSFALRTVVETTAVDI
jgi:Lrp/AsnC family leucine-responsive transcriptional regulator